MKSAVAVLRSLPLPIKGACLAFGTLAIVLGIQLLLQGRVSQEWLFCLPLVVAPMVTIVVVRTMLSHRLSALAEGVQRLGQGELGIELPPTPDPDFESLRLAFRDMSRELKRLTTELERRDATRRRLFADLAHDIATPVSSLLGLMEALANPEIAPDEATKERLRQTISGEVERLASLTEDVRDLAGLDDPDLRLRLEDVDLADVAAAAVESLAVGAGARIVTRLQPAAVRGDRQRLHQVMTNLLTNARRYAPAEGTIRVETGVGSVAFVVVEDDGPGVPDEELEKLGERFHRPDPSRSRRRGGHGLGLAIVLAIAHRHGGAVIFDRSALGGLCVRVELPPAG